MKRFRLPVIFLVVVGIVPGCIGYKKNSDREIFYKWKNGNLVHVFNMSKMLFSEEGENYLSRRDGRYTEFGGDFVFCDSDKYLCIVGGIAAAVPKDMSGQTEWVYKNWGCKSDRPVYENTSAHISCSYKGQVTEFLYDSAHGITSYTNRGKATEKQMQLVGTVGLLAR